MIMAKEEVVTTMTADIQPHQITAAFPCAAMLANKCSHIWCVSHERMLTEGSPSRAFFAHPGHLMLFHFGPHPITIPSPSHRHPTALPPPLHRPTRLIFARRPADT